MIMRRKMAWTSFVFVVAMLLVSSPPAFGTTVTINDPNETGVGNQDIPDGYDIEKLIFDDSDGTTSYLRITYDLYGNVMIHDYNRQVQYLLSLGVGGFDQDPLTDDPETPGHTKVDFEINWYASQIDGQNNDLYALGKGKPSWTLEVLGQNGTVLYTTVTTDPTGGDTVVLDIPWAILKDTSGNWAFPDMAINPPSFGGVAVLDNGASYQDDYLPDSGDFNVPEPITMAGMLMAVGGLAGYIRRRRMA